MQSKILLRGNRRGKQIHVFGLDLKPFVRAILRMANVKVIVTVNAQEIKRQENVGMVLEFDANGSTAG